MARKKFTLSFCIMPSSFTNSSLSADEYCTVNMALSLPGKILESVSPRLNEYRLRKVSKMFTFGAVPAKLSKGRKV